MTLAELRTKYERLLAERRAGELLREMAERGERATPGEGRPGKVSHAATLTALGVNRSQSSRWQKLAAVPKHQEPAA